MEGNADVDGGRGFPADGPSRVADTWRGTLVGVVAGVAFGRFPGGAVLDANAGEEGEQ